MANVVTAGGTKAGPMTGEEKKVIFASSLGTVFEWYDFYLYGSLAVYIGATFFSQYPETTRNIFALLALPPASLSGRSARWFSAAWETSSAANTHSSSPS
ncbi:hypothetical protein LZK74_33645 (plasmid) [Sinorhizobium meliloti]|nr:hypothetical protein LZK74_33645 [Sinorhizobium meliloti]